MLHCGYCDFLKAFSDSEESKLCNKYMCEYSKHVFLDSEFSELNEHPCTFLPVYPQPIPTLIETRNSCYPKSGRNDEY